MRHARKDYDRIQDPENKIPEDEPVFLLRAQDKVAPMVVEIWSLAAELSGASEDIVEAAFEHADLMRVWQSKNPTKVKVPDMPSEQT